MKWNYPLMDGFVRARVCGGASVKKKENEALLERGAPGRSCNSVKPYTLKMTAVSASFFEHQTHCSGPDFKRGNRRGAFP